MTKKRGIPSTHPAAKKAAGWKPRRKVTVGGLAGAIAGVAVYFGMDAQFAEAFGALIVAVVAAYFAPGEALAQVADAFPPEPKP